MAGFSAAAWLAAHAPWTYTTARGRTYAARPISAPRVAQYHAATEDLPVALHAPWLRALLREAFPWRFSFAWRGDPVDEILRAPPRVREAILDSFFASLGLTVRPPRIPMSSRASSST